MMRALRDRAELALVYAVLGPLALMPAGMGGALGSMLYRLMPGRRGIAIENLRLLVRPGGVELGGRSQQEVIHSLFRHVGRSLSELAKIYMGLGHGVVEAVEVEGFEHVERARAEGRGVLFISGHLGNWELGGLTLPRIMGRGYAIVKAQKNPRLNLLIERTRRRYGGELIYQEGALREFIRVLKAGEAAGVVMDEEARAGQGVEVEFLGGGRMMSRMPAMVARRTGAAVLPIFTYSQPGGGHLVRIYPEVLMTGDELADTQAMARHIEGYVRERPDRWMLLLRRWGRRKKRGHKIVEGAQAR